MAPAAKYVLAAGISRIALYMAMNGASPPSDGRPPLYGGARGTREEAKGLTPVKRKRENRTALTILYKVTARRSFV